MLIPDYQIDLNWLERIAYKLPRFKKQGGKGVYACVCINCGDPKHKKSKLYFYTKKGSLNFDCKKCGISGSFFNFMRQYAPEQFEEYKREQVLKRLEQQPDKRKPKPKVVKEKKKLEHVSGLEDCYRLTDLPDNHIAVEYVRSRGMTESEYKHLMYTDNFASVYEQIDPAVDEESRKRRIHFVGEERLIIPFYTESEGLVMVQGRSFDPDTKMRYISVKRDEDVEKTFGLDRVNRDKPVVCVEGPIDSLFVDNSLAACDANLTRINADIYCWDNQPRSKEIVEYMERAIEAGKKIVIWPTSPNKKMDINDIILLGMNRSELNEVIHQCVYSGIRAKLELNRWRKV